MREIPRVLSGHLMRYAAVVRRSFPGPGGIAMMLRTVTTGMAALGHDVRVIAARIDDAPVSRLNATLTPQRFAALSVDGVTVSQAPAGLLTRAAAAPMAAATAPGLRSLLYNGVRSLTAATYPRAAGGELARTLQGADVIHAWGGEHLPWAAAVAARKMGVPLVVTPFAHSGAWGDDPINAAFYSKADAVLCLVPSEADLYDGLGVERSRLHVVGVPVTPRPEPTFDVRQRYGLRDAPLVLSLGVKATYKGYRTLLNALPQVWEKAPLTRVAFVGPRTAESRADFSSDRDPRVIEEGEVSDADVTAWLRAADVVCLPSTSEILPVTILDAWGQGKPVVAGRWWCAADLVEHDTDGVIVEATTGAVADALLGYVNDPVRARAHGDAGRIKVNQRFSPEAVVARHLDVIASVT